VLEVLVPVRLVNPKNQRGHWAQHWRTVCTLRDATTAAVYRAHGRSDALTRLRRLVAAGGRLHITLTPILPRAFDSDGCVAAVAPIRDELAALLMPGRRPGQGDGPADGHVWTVAPAEVTRDRGRFGCRVRVEGA
jgi:hypothetical protein